MQMRDMKTIFNYMTIMALLLTFTGCEEEEVMTFGEERGVNFVIYEAAYGTYKDDYKNLETEYNFFKEYVFPFRQIQNRTRVNKIVQHYRNSSDFCHLQLC